VGVRQALAANPARAYGLGHLTQLQSQWSNACQWWMPSGCACRTERASNCCKVTAVVFGCLCAAASIQMVKPSRVQTVQLDCGCPRWHLPQNVSGRTRGRSVSFSPDGSMLAEWSRCPRAALGLAARNLLQSFARTHKLDLGSGISSESNGSEWQHETSAAMGCEMAPAAKHCRDIRVWLTCSVSAPMDKLAGV